MKIHNGDHAEFEIEHANTKPEDRPDWPLPSFDAMDWAKAFHKVNPSVAVDDTLGWFASALMRGYDECSRASRRETFLDWLGRRNWWAFRLNCWLHQRRSAPRT